MRSKFLVLLTVALFAGRAYPIGRIGNNDRVPGHNGELQDDVEGFVAAVPGKFPDILSAKDRSAKLVSNESFDGDGLMADMPGYGNLTMFAYPLSSAYPSWLDKSESEVSDILRTQDGFVVSEIVRTKCAFFLYGENDVGYIGVAKWGTHGYVLTTQKSASGIGKSGILTILKSTQIDDPCTP